MDTDDDTTNVDVASSGKQVDAAACGGGCRPMVSIKMSSPQRVVTVNSTSKLFREIREEE